MLSRMCNLYSMTRNADAIRRLFRVRRDHTGNLPPLAGIYPDTLAPVIRLAPDGERELLWMRWGFPPPPQLASRPITNVRNTASPYWRGWLKPGFRCLIPVSSFCEWTDATPKVATWFARDAAREPFAFAGIWRPWTGTRGTKADPVEGEHLLFSFLTTEANATVRPVHAKAMPVCLLDESAWDRWLKAPVPDALALQTPAPADALRIIVTGPKTDPAPVL